MNKWIRLTGSGILEEKGSERVREIGCKEVRENQSKIFFLSLIENKESTELSGFRLDLVKSEFVDRIRQESKVCIKGTLTISDYRT
jgi:DNA replication protein DnaC